MVRLLQRGTVCKSACYAKGRHKTDVEKWDGRLEVIARLLHSVPTVCVCLHSANPRCLIKTTSASTQRSIVLGVLGSMLEIKGTKACNCRALNISMCLHRTQAIEMMSAMCFRPVATRLSICARAMASWPLTGTTDSNRSIVIILSEDSKDGKLSGISKTGTSSPIPHHASTSSRHSCRGSGVPGGGFLR